MGQQPESEDGGYGRSGYCEPLEICGRVVFRLPADTVPATDPAALGEGYCPNCPGVELGGHTRRWCPECRTYWRLPARRAAPRPGTRGPAR
jgi:hypothetical protein